MEDATGWKVWGELNIQVGIQTITIPQNFIDTAIYPIRYASGERFGYETQGGSSGNITCNTTLQASKFAGAPASGV